MPISYKKNELEEKMLLNVHQKEWSYPLKFQKDMETHNKHTAEQMTHMLKLAELYNKSVQEELKMTEEELQSRHVGKQDPKRHLRDAANESIQENLDLTLKTMVDLLAFTK
eukprot:NODE_36_length_36011_cov_1.012920.p24 type:complete len:111 gc:universal NODE_36_length_36011_cov_1.012920:28939-28607(-)